MNGLADEDPNVMIGNEELSDLLARGVIDQSQAFLIYELFHSKRTKTDEFLKMDKDTYVIFDTIPVCFTLNILISLIVLLFFITQTCMKHDQPSLLF